MAQKKKLQVFVSSTYTDLREERQAAVEAILKAGHIPAGMELFTAGDTSQMSAIKHWIDESDVYLLILGGRYGSIEPESGKSYIHLEYEYAAEKGKPLFAVVIDEAYAKARVKTHPLGADVIETENTPKLREFRSQVKSKIVEFWSKPEHIKLAIMETLAEFSRREALSGWVPGSEAANAHALAGQVARLGKENEELREHLSHLSASTYIGALPKYYPEVISLIENARESVSILCDYPAYGCYSNSESWFRYHHAIALKSAKTSFRITLVCPTPEVRDEADETKYFQPASRDWDSWLEATPTGADAGLTNRERVREFARYAARVIKREIDFKAFREHPTKEEFFKLLQLADEAMLKDFSDREDCVHLIPAQIPLDCWIADGTRAVFAFSNYVTGMSRYGFSTTDQTLIKAFQTMVDSYS